MGNNRKSPVRFQNKVFIGRIKGLATLRIIECDRMSRRRKGGWKSSALRNIVFKMNHHALNPEHLALTRRGFLRRCGMGMGALGLANLLGNTGLLNLAQAS